MTREADEDPELGSFVDALYERLVLGKPRRTIPRNSPQAEENVVETRDVDGLTAHTGGRE